MQNYSKPKAFFVVSEWNNDISWVKEYTDDYVIFDKSNTLPADEPKVLKVPNVGYNIHDSAKFIVDNYNNLPDVIAFLEGNPFDHVNRETFHKLIYNAYFTPLETYEHIPESYAHKKCPDTGQYMEINTSWYLVLPPPFEHRFYNSFDEFMNEFFVDYEHVNWIRFSPGAQYVVPKENILKYSKRFYEKIMDIVGYCRLPMESHLLERAMFYIFSNKYEERK